MIPNISSRTSAGIFLPNKFASFGDDTLLRGGIEIRDGSKGIDYQTWKAHIVGGNTIRLETVIPGGGTTVDLPMAGVTQASVAFDRSMNPNYAYVVAGVCFLKWFDTNANAYVTTTFTGGERNILVCHDDVRDTSSTSSDVICAYQRGHGVFWSQQRDRYLNEYTANPAIQSELTAIGMGSQWCFLFRTSPG